MNSIFKELEKNYDLFTVFNGEIIKLFKFSEDIYTTFEALLNGINPSYSKGCEIKGKSIKGVSKVEIKKDTNNKCYIKILGNDDKTILIIRSDDSHNVDYNDIIGYKITESQFKEKLDEIQKEKLKSYNISSRFLKEQPDELDLKKEMNIELLIRYYKYLKQYLKKPILFDEPINANSSREIPSIKSETVDRKNNVLDYNIRRQELMKYNPKKILEMIGKKTAAKYEAFIYESNGYVLAIIEPLSGTGHQYNLNLGPIDINDEDLIIEMLKATMEAKRNIISMDDAIIRKNHTTMDMFKESLEIFLGNNQKMNSFQHKTEAAKSVYIR